MASLTDARKAEANQPQPATSESAQAYYDNNKVAKNDPARAEKEATRAATGPAAPPAKEVPAIAKGTADATSTAAAEPPPPAAPKAAAVEAEEDRPADALKLKKDAPVEKQAAAREANKERDEANKNEPSKAETVTVTQGNAARKDIAVRSAKSTETNVARGTNDFKRAPSTATGTASAGGQADSRSREQQKEQSKPTGNFASAETRSVAGRRFQKRGAVWTDSDYDSSKPVTNVARGSEQYRALIGDEPSIREIADQLAGEIIVVWKGRTYRIR